MSSQEIEQFVAMLGNDIDTLDELSQAESGRQMLATEIAALADASRRLNNLVSYLRVGLPAQEAA